MGFFSSWLKAKRKSNASRAQAPVKKHRMFRNLELERLEERLAPTAAVTFAAASVTINLSTAAETATVNIASGHYTITDTAGLGTVSGGTASGSNTIYTSTALASAQTTFTISTGSLGTVA